MRSLRSRSDGLEAATSGLQRGAFAVAIDITVPAREQGFAASDSRDVVALMLGQNPGMVALLRQAGRMLGEVLASLVNTLNPAVIVIGGDIARADEPLFAGVREIVYQRSTTLATRHLQIVRSQLGDRAGVCGAAIIAIEHILSPDAIDAEFRAAG